MNASHATVGGTLKPDGTVELDEKVDLPPGPVRVTLEARPAEAATGEDWWACLQRLRAEREAAGYPFRTEQGVHAHVEDLRSGDELP